ncbi:MAG: META domain-containing protein [Candidatus Kapaibacterium sp.]
MKRKLSLLALALIACLTVQSCREMGINPWDKGNGGTNTTLSMEKLVGTKWQLVSIERDGTSSTMYVPKGKQITLNFESLTQVSGILICNSYGASVKSDKAGEVKFVGGAYTEVYCPENGLYDEYTNVLYSAQTYKTTDKELRITYSPGHLGYGISKTLVFVPVTSNDGELDLRIKQLAGHTFTLYSFVNAGIEDVQTNAQNCMITFNPTATGKGSAAILADCNKGTADLSFSADYESMKLDNIGLSKMACQNQLTADRFVEFLRNVGHFEYRYSVYGSTLTLWSSLTTIGESKMVLVDYSGLDILQTPASGVPVGSYPSFTLTDAVFDGQNIKINYQYNGKTADYRLSAYSLFDLGKSNPPVVFVDLVSDGSMNPFSSITSGEAHLSLNAIRARILIASPGKTALTVQLRWNGQVLKSIPVIL